MGELCPLIYDCTYMDLAVREGNARLMEMGGALRGLGDLWKNKLKTVIVKGRKMKSAVVSIVIYGLK